MIEAGSDPRIKNKAKLTPYMLTDPRNERLRAQLQDAVDVMLGQGDFIVDEDVRDVGGEEVDAYAGSGSDSDFDPEEYRLEQERRDREKKKKGGMANGA